MLEYIHLWYIYIYILCLPGPPKAPPRAHSSGLGRLSGRLASRIHATLSATCMRPSQQPLQGGPKPSKTIGVLVNLKKVAKTLVVLHFSISESATLQAFLLLLFSKCQHSNDFTTCLQKNTKQQGIAIKKNVSGCHIYQNDKKTQSCFLQLFL